MAFRSRPPAADGGRSASWAPDIIRSRYPAYARALGWPGGYGNFNDGFDGWGDLSGELEGFGDVCTRTENRYKKLKAKIKRKKKLFKKRGRRFMWIRTGSGKKWIKNKNAKLKKIRRKAAGKSCSWVGRKSRKKKIKKLKQEEKALEKQLEIETQETSAALEAATKEAIESQAEEAKQPGSNPFLVLGIVAGIGLVMVVLAKKK